MLWFAVEPISTQCPSSSGTSKKSKRPRLNTITRHRLHLCVNIILLWDHVQPCSNSSSRQHIHRVYDELSEYGFNGENIQQKTHFFVCVYLFFINIYKLFFFADKLMSEYCYIGILVIRLYTFF